MPGPLSVSPRPNDIDERSLKEDGFTDEEVARLREIRDSYPFLEYADSRSEWHRLRFVKWLYLKGEFKR